VPPLPTIFQKALWATAFWLLGLLQVAGWLRLIRQAENPENSNQLLENAKAARRNRRYFKDF
jgi:hypothetical protein